MDAERAVVFDDPPVAEAHHALGLRGDVGLVGDQHDGAPFGVEVGEDREHVLGRVGVEVAGRLVGEDQRGVGDDRAGDRDALLLAAGELGGEVVQAVGHAHRRQRPFGAAAALGAVQAGVGERQFDVGERGGAGDEVEGLEDEAELAVAQVGELVLVEVVGVGAVDQVAPAGGDVEAAKDVHQRALAAAGAAHDRDEVAALDAQRDAAQRWHADRADRVGLADVADVDDRTESAASSGV